MPQQWNVKTYGEKDDTVSFEMLKEKRNVCGVILYAHH